MKRDINYLLEKILKESVYSIDDIQKAIETNTPVVINRAVNSETGSTISQFNIVPVSMQDDIIIGESDELGSIEFSLEDVEKINFLDEAGIKVNMATLSKMDASQLDKVAQKSDVFITEAEFLKNIKEDLEGKEEEEDNNNLQELAVYNVKNWATQLELDISAVKNYGQNVKEITFIETNRPYTVLIYPDGGIRLSNHTVRNFNDFKNIIEFYKNYNE